MNGQTRDFIYDLSGRNIDEYTPGGSGWLGIWTRGEAYAGSLHIATYANGTTEFDNSDWLSTFRARSDVSGNRIETCTSLPFGEDLTCTGTEVTPIHFTGKERDGESGNDFFGARYYTSTMGRFLTPDWAEKPTNVPYAHFGNPQSLNLYSYVQNNPTTVGDPDGHDGGGPDASWQTDPQAKANGVTQNTTAAAVTAAPTTMEAIDAVVKPLVESAAGALETAGTTLLDIGASALLAGAYLISPGSGGANNGNDTIQGHESSSSPEPQAAAGGAGARQGGGVNSNGQRTDDYGRTLGPSGKPMIHNPQFNSEKAAKDAARNAGQGAPIKHPSPTVGGPHFHATDANGEKVRDGVHYNYPD